MAECLSCPRCRVCLEHDVSLQVVVCGHCRWAWHVRPSPIPPTLGCCSSCKVGGVWKDRLEGEEQRCQGGVIAVTDEGGRDTPPHSDKIGGRYIGLGSLVGGLWTRVLLCCSVLLWKAVEGGRYLS